MIARGAPHNSDARQPQDINQWPLPIIVDLSYASAVLQEWGHETLIGRMWQKSKDAYYGGGTEGDDNEDEDASGARTGISSANISEYTGIPYTS